MTPEAVDYVNALGIGGEVLDGIKRALQVCGEDARAYMQLSQDPDDGSVTVLVKLYAPKPFEEILDDVSRFNREWQAGVGASEVFDDVLFMAGIDKL